MNKRILIKGYFNYNFGDDLFVKILLKNFPDDDFKIIAPKSYESVWNCPKTVTCVGTPINTIGRIVARVSKFFGYSLYKKIYAYCYIRYYTKMCKKIDAFVVLGGSMFKEGNNWEMEAFLNQVTIDSMGLKPCFVIGANFGPFKSVQFFDFYKKYFSRFTDICFRDAYSKNLFSEFSNVRQEKDVVFQLQIPDHRVINKSVGIVAINLMQHPDVCTYAAKYKEFLINLINNYYSKGFSVSLIAFQKDEESFIDSILAESANKDINKLIYQGNVEDFLKKYLTFSLVFATRFHSMIISMKAGQRFCPIIYNQKMDNVLDDIHYNGVRVRLNNLQLSDSDLNNIENMEPIKVDNFSISASEQFKGIETYIKQ